MKKLALFAGVVLITAAFFGSGCEKVPTAGEENSAKLDTTTQAGAEGVNVPGTVATVVIGTIPFSVEIAKTDEERAKGLMNRESIADDAGMWFEFPKSGQEAFYMKDTLIPLDWIFIDENMKIVDIKANNLPNSEDIYAPSVPYKFALEVKAGMAAKHGFKVGDTVEKRIGPK